MVGKVEGSGRQPKGRQETSQRSGKSKQSATSGHRWTGEKSGVINGPCQKIEHVVYALLSRSAT